MESPQIPVIGIKVGSNLVVQTDFLKRLVLQIATLRHAGRKVFLVSSGAVAHDPNTKRSKNHRAAIGQGRLIAKYSLLFEELGYEVAQLLVTRHDLEENSGVFRRTMTEMLNCRKTIAVINANDVVDDEEIEALGRYVDNDWLFYGVCQIVGVDMALIGIDQPGLLDHDGCLIETVESGNLPEAFRHVKSGSLHGHGREGMKTKLVVLNKLASELGIKSVLVPALEMNAFVLAADFLLGRNDEQVGTVFL